MVINYQYVKFQNGVKISNGSKEFLRSIKDKNI